MQQRKTTTSTTRAAQNGPDLAAVAHSIEQAKGLLTMYNDRMGEELQAMHEQLETNAAAGEYFYSMYYKTTNTALLAAIDRITEAAAALQGHI